MVIKREREEEEKKRRKKGGDPGACRFNAVVTGKEKRGNKKKEKGERDKPS